MLIQVLNFKFNYIGRVYYNCIISRDLFDNKLIREIIKCS